MIGRWLGCVSGHDPPSPGPGSKGNYTFPEVLTTSVGEPVDAVCKETAKGVFERRWSKGTVKMDCNTWTGTIPGWQPAGAASHVV